jgi:hypothetical protein
MRFSSRVQEISREPQVRSSRAQELAIPDGSSSSASASASAELLKKRIEVNVICCGCKPSI